MRLFRCNVCGKRIWFFPIRVVIKMSDNDIRKFYLHSNCLAEANYCITENKWVKRVNDR